MNKALVGLKDVNGNSYMLPMTSYTFDNEYCSGTVTILTSDLLMLNIHIKKWNKYYEYGASENFVSALEVKHIPADIYNGGMYWNKVYYYQAFNNRFDTGPIPVEIRLIGMYGYDDSEGFVWTTPLIVSNHTEANIDVSIIVSGKATPPHTA